MPRKSLIQLRRGQESEWTSENPVLAAGEIAFDKTNRQIRVGDGTTSWSSLTPLSGSGVGEGGGGSGVDIPEYYSFCALPGGSSETHTGNYVGLSMDSIPADFLTSNHSWWAAVRISRVGVRDDQIWSICDGGIGSAGFGWRPVGDYFAKNTTSSYLITCDNDTPVSSNIWIIFQWDDDTSRYDAWVDTVQELDQRSHSSPTTSQPTSISWLRRLYSSSYFYNFRGSISAIVIGNGNKLTQSEAQALTGSKIKYEDLDSGTQAKATHAWSFDGSSVVTDLGGIGLTPEVGTDIGGFEYTKDTYEPPQASISDSSITLDNDESQNVDLSTLVTNRGGVSLTYSKISGESWMGTPSSSGVANIDASGVTPSGYSGQYRITDGDSNTSDMTLTVTVNQAPETFLEEDWESGLNGWSQVDGALNNWFVGTAVNNGGTQSAYVSSDSGTSNDYNKSTTTISHIYKTFTSPSDVSGGVNLAFDWKCNGESSYDYLRLHIIPDAQTPTGGTELSTTYNVSGGSTRLNLQTTWQSASIDVSSLIPSSSTDYKIVLSWKNDSSGGVDPGAAVDNIELTS